MKLIHCILTLYYLLNSAATAATFPCVYDPCRSTAEHGLQTLAPANNGRFSSGKQFTPLPNIYGDGYDDPAPVDNLDFALYSGTRLELIWDRAQWGLAPLIYEISRNQEIVAFVDRTSWMDYNVNTHRYDYKVTTIDARGRRSRAQLLTVSVHREQPLLRPTMPEQLTASVRDNQSIELAWQRSNIGTPVIGFEIYREGLKMADTTLTHYVDNSTIVNMSYHYEVVAYDKVGQKSEVAKIYAGVFIPVAPVAPARASAIAHGPAQLRFSGRK